ncbi:MAG: pilus assembly PilX N-terminal domain-containing protein [Deltaproteobacteria bacterium]|nr:pilus assembly PilX N-terminal domain-containing protein [Deltaproteobacteria bacterium]
MALVLLTILSMIGSGAYMIATTDLKIAGAYKQTKSAFYNAQAGIQYALAAVENGLLAGTFVLPETDDDNTFISRFNALMHAAGAPDGFNFTVEPVEMYLPPNMNTNFDLGPRFVIHSTGYGPGDAQVTIEATWQERQAFYIDYGAFGNLLLDFKSSGAIYSYDSALNPNPAGGLAGSGGDSTGDGDIGSNTAIQLYNQTIVDGDVALGQDNAGNDGHLTNRGAIITGADGVELGEQVPGDPLGIIGGDLEKDFSDAVTNNDNSSIVIIKSNVTGSSKTFHGTSLNVSNGETAVLTGPADYYFTSVTLRQGASLEVDASAGPVNIYLSGPFEAKNGSMININGEPTDFSLYSNSTDSIIFKHGSSLKGLVYAPFASVELKNSASVYGAIWAQQMDIKNSGEMFFDMQLKRKFEKDTNEVLLIDWKELRS